MIRTDRPELLVVEQPKVPPHRHQRDGVQWGAGRVASSL